MVSVRNDGLGIRFLVCLGTMLLLALYGVTAASAQSNSGTVVVATVNEAILPPVRDYLARSLAQAERENAACLLVEINTPGGRVDTTREIVRLFLEAKVPVLVYVTPTGSRAGSAGAIIGLSGTLLAMSPQTNIGAAHPVGGSGENLPSDMRTKVENDMAAFVRSIAEKRGKNAVIAEQIVRQSVSLTENEAVKLNYADLVAANRTDLLQQIEGRLVKTTAGEATLRTFGAIVKPVAPSLTESFLMLLLQPNVTLLLVIVATFGILTEFVAPGVSVPGIVGSIALVLALYSMSVLSVNAVGAMLLVLSLALFITDLHAASHGILTLGGAAAFICGGLMLFGNATNTAHVSVSLVVTLGLLMALFFGTVVAGTLRSRRRQGTTSLIGDTAEARSDFAAGENSVGRVFMEGAYWNAVNCGGDPIVSGDRVKVEGRDGLTLRVRRSEHAPAEPIYKSAASDAPAADH